MAEMGVGLTKAVIVGTIGKVMSAIAEEAELKKRVQNDMEFMKAEFQMMQAFLGVADEERLKNIVVRTWVRQIRDLAYDVEDYFEVFVYLDLKKSTWGRRLVPLPPCVARPLPLDEAVASIKRLRARVEDVSQRNLRYRLIGDSGSKPIPEDPAAAATFVIRRGLVEAAWKQRDLRSLTMLITGEGSDLQERQVISVLGAEGDLKTSSIIRKAYTDPKICQDFPNRAWTKPMLHPFDPDEFIRSLLTQFYANSRSDERAESLMEMRMKMKMKMKAAANTENGLMKEFMQRVQSERYLVVIEDLSTTVEWDAIRMYLPDEKNGSRIIVSTRQLAIASLCTGEPYKVSGLRELPDDDSVCVFSNEESRCLLSFDDMRKEASESMAEFKLVGRHREMGQLDLHINSAARPGVGKYHVACVWGIAGVGKSALVRTLYYNEMLSDDSIFQQYSWVDVPHPFSLAEFSRRLHWYSRLQADKTAVVEHSYSLIVIDDIRSVEEWDLIRASLSMPTRYTVIIITDDESVAEYCARTANNELSEFVLNIKCLEVGAAFHLLEKEIGRSVDMFSNPFMHQFGGLPKVIVDVWRHRGLGIPLGHRFMRELETKPAYASLGGLIAWMRFFFRTCPDSLKPYIYYLLVFPLGCNIRQGRLVRRWIAEGFSKDTDGRRAEENLDKIFSKLVDLSIIQRSSKDRLWMVNGFFREYMLSQPMEDNLVFVLHEGRSQPSQHRERHLSMQRWRVHLFMDIHMVCESIDFSQVRSLTVSGIWWRHQSDGPGSSGIIRWSRFIPCEMLLLQVLDLEDARGAIRNDDLVSLFEKVPRLKFLSLRGCEEITSLPSSLFALKYLQTLDVRGTGITKLPPAMIKLKKLQYFRAGRPLPLDDGDGTAATLPGADASVGGRPRTFWSKSKSVRPYNGGVAVPHGMWRLEALDTLGVVDVGAAGGEAVKRIWWFDELRKLGVSGINRGNIKLFSSGSRTSFKLESLSVRLDKDNEDYCRQLDEMHIYKLWSLKLYGPIGKFPAKWISQLSSLRKLALQMIMFAPADMDAFDRLWNLHTLRLFVNQFQDDKLSMSAKVVDLELACKSSLHVTFEGRAIEKLEVLKVHCFGETRMQISGLQNLESIREVCLKGSRDDKLEQDLEGQIKSYPAKPGLMGPALRVEWTRRSSASS